MKTKYTVKPVLRVHLWGKEKKRSFKTGDLLKEVQFTGQEKSDLLTQVTA